MDKIIKSVKIAIGILMLFLSSFGMVFGIFAMIDPVGMQMSDDSDPLGIPPTFVETLSRTLFYAGVFLTGIWSIIGSKEIVRLFGRKLQ